MKYFMTLLVLLSFTLVGCHDSDGDGIPDEVDETPNGETTPTGPTTTTKTELFGTNGNIWKPVSDVHASGGGNMVALFDSSYTRQFDTCEIMDVEGNTVPLLCINNQPWTQIPFSCFSNGNRQTWRAPFGCRSIALVQVTCKYLSDATIEEVVFTVDASVRGSVCNRFG